jgi:DDE superfamily endonuclease
VRRGEPKKAMTQATKQKRLMFAKGNKTTAWEKVLFTGRKRFYFRYPGSKVKMVRWRLEGKDYTDEVFQPTNPQCLNIYAGISKYGITGVHVVAGTSKHTTKYVTKKGTSARNITSAQYGDVLRKTLLPCGEKLLGQKYGAWCLQQDNDPSHKCAQRVTKRWAKEKGFKVEVLPNWPPNSPDLNIIENVWAWVQREVDKLGCENFEEFHQSVVQTLAKVPASMIANLYASMKERVKLVVEREGGFTGY